MKGDQTNVDSMEEFNDMYWVTLTPEQQQAYNDMIRKKNRTFLIVLGILVGIFVVLPMVVIVGLILLFLIFAQLGFSH